MKSMVCVIVLVSAMSLCACSSSTGSAGTATSTPAAAATATVSLPDGWTMQDAISADEVAAITGEAMQYFPEAGSAAQSGRPSCGYTIAGKDDSKIFFSAEVQGGEAAYTQLKEYARDGTIQDVDGIGDQAYTCTFTDGRRGIVALKGSAVVRVDWSPAVYDADPQRFGGQLVTKVLEGMFD